MRAQIPILSSQSIFLFGKSSASCTFYLGPMELLCTLGGNIINPDRSEKKLIGQGHKRQNLGSVVHCIGRLHHLHQHWHRRHWDWGQGSVSVLRVTNHNQYFHKFAVFWCWWQISGVTSESETFERDSESIWIRNVEMLRQKSGLPPERGAWI